MFNSLSVFLEKWEKEAEATQKLFDTLTDASLKQEVGVSNRTLGRISWHIVTTIDEMIGRTGLTFGIVEEDAPVPDSAHEIAEAYRNACVAMAQAMKEQWVDGTLAEEREMYGESWTIGETLYVLISHQAHHRGQMTVLMRQAGLVVPGICGPSREEWGQFGMEAPQV